MTEQAHDRRERHRREHHAVEDQVVLEVEEDHLHEHEHEDAAKREQAGRAGQGVTEHHEKGCGNDRRPVHLPALESRLQALEAGELDGSPAHPPSGQGPDHGPDDRDDQGVHGVRASRIASTGAGFPVQISNERAPWATSTRQPSAVRRPSERALRTSGVPPAT